VENVLAHLGSPLPSEILLEVPFHASKYLIKDMHLISAQGEHIALIILSLI
jgi:hypothetical protein